MNDPVLAKAKLVGYADMMVKEKHIHKRIYNSNTGLIAEVRRGLQRDDGNKFAGLAQKLGPSLLNKTANSAIKKIPVVGTAPVISGVITEFSNTIYDEAKAKFRNKKLKAALADNNDDEIVKFKLKTFSFPDLDSYRQKLEVALRNYNDVVRKSTKSFGDEIKKGSICNYHLDICLAASQVERRLTKMIDAYNAIDSIASVLKQKIQTVQKEFSIGESQYWDEFDKAIALNNDAVHRNCTKCVRSNNDFSAPLDSRFASFISSNKVFSAIVKNTFDSAVNEGYSRYGAIIEKA